ncbi:MAG: hypothetical protein OHK0039_42860 [Bacteroidia bacterium]
MKRLSLSLLCCLLLAPALLMAQSWQQKLDQMQERIALKQQHQQSRVDLQYANQIRRLWLQVEMEQPIDRPVLPDPDFPRVYDPGVAPEDRQGTQWAVVPPGPDDPSFARQPADEQIDDAQVEAAMPPAIATDLRKLDREVQAAYFGQQITVRYDSRMNLDLRGRITEARIADAWTQLDGTKHELLLYQLTRQARDMRLNDWGFCQLISTTAQRIYPNDKNARVLFSWFCLAKSGYIATVSYDNDRIYLLVPSQQTLYGMSYVNAKDGKLYAIDLEGGPVALNSARVFRQKYPEADRRLDLRVQQAPRFPSRTQRRMLEFTYAKQTYRIPVEVNRNAIDFYKTYPFVDMGIYLAAPLSAEAYQSLVDTLRVLARGVTPTKGRTAEEEGVNFLLRFTQTALSYKPDGEQFGGEKYLFADETLFYPYSDCEDRAILFGQLVREIFKLDIVGLIYPGHAATAVAFSRRVPGDYLTYEGRHYLICDPTYIGADCGVSLPDVQGQQVKVIPF